MPNPDDLPPVAVAGHRFDDPWAVLSALTERVQKRHRRVESMPGLEEALATQRSRSDLGAQLAEWLDTHLRLGGSQSQAELQAAYGVTAVLQGRNFFGHRAKIPDQLRRFDKETMLRPDGVIAFLQRVLLPYGLDNMSDEQVVRASTAARAIADFPIDAQFHDAKSCRLALADLIIDVHDKWGGGNGRFKLVTGIVTISRGLLTTLASLREGDPEFGQIPRSGLASARSYLVILHQPPSSGSGPALGE